MKKFTVLLLYPDYMSDNFGQDTCMAHVNAEDVARAQEAAQARMVQIRLEYDEEDGQDPDDYFVLMVIEGHHNDIKEPT